MGETGSLGATDVSVTKAETGSLGVFDTFCYATVAETGSLDVTDVSVVLLWQKKAALMFLFCCGRNRQP